MDVKTQSGNAPASIRGEARLVISSGAKTQISMNPFEVSEEQAARAAFETLKKSFKLCADCHDLIVPNVDLTHGIFLCNICTTFHRSVLGKCQIKTIAFTKWKQSQVVDFKSKKGNETNARIERLLKDKWPSIPTKQEDLEAYLVAKYKLWDTGDQSSILPKAEVAPLGFDNLAQDVPTLPAPDPTPTNMSRSTKASNEKLAPPVPTKSRKVKSKKKSDIKLTDDFFETSQTDIFGDSAPNEVKQEEPYNSLPLAKADVQLFPTAEAPINTQTSNASVTDSTFTWSQPVAKGALSSLEDLWGTENLAVPTSTDVPAQSVDLLDLSLEEDRRTQKRFQV